MTNRTDMSSSIVLYSAAAAAALGLAATFAVRLPSTGPLKPRTIISSPLKTLLPRLSVAQRACLGYPPDALPGARDVSTPYGSMRVYEWGPIEGMKVVMVHGDATPAPMFGRIADQLVKRGCRVICMDLWGRGYSDTPSGMHHNSDLYARQIGYALTSSTSNQQQISLIGFSMGCSIVLNYFAANSSTVRGLVLLGPGGLIRNLPAEYQRLWFRFSWLAPAALMRGLIGTLLGVNLHPTDDIANAIEGKAKAAEEGFTPAGSLQFQFDHHQGHVESFLSTIQYGPLQHQEATWEQASDIIISEKAVKGIPPVMDTPSREHMASPMHKGKILVVCGDDDSVVPPADVLEDLQKYFTHPNGTKHYEFKTVPGTHGFPWPEGTNIGKLIVEFWRL